MSVVLTPAALPSATVVKVVNPLATGIDSTFEDSYHRRLAYTSGPSCTSAIQIARQARLIACMRDSSLSLWRIPTKRVQSSDGDIDDDSSNVVGWEKVLEMDLKVHTNLVACAISDDGRWLVVSDLYETKLFSLTTNVSDSTYVSTLVLADGCTCRGITVSSSSG